MPSEHELLLDNTEDNIEESPTRILPAAKVYTLGDLHANTLKLLHFLLISQTVEWVCEGSETPKELYTRFANLYYLNSPEFAHLQRLIQKLKLKENPPFIRLIGDELADRGRNDLYTLYLLDHLSNQGLKYDCCFSNHTSYFFGVFHNYITFHTIPNRVDETYHSIVALYAHLKHKFEPSEFHQLVVNHLSHLTIISYGLIPSGIIQYTHAPTSHHIAKYLAKKLHTFYTDTTPEALAFSIELINDEFQKKMKNGTWRALFNMGAIKKLARFEYISEEEYPFECCIWNRCYHLLDRSPITNGYSHYSLYGHDSLEPKRATHTFCVDSNCGKLEGAFFTSNPILCSQEWSLSLERRVELVKSMQRPMLIEIIDKVKKNYGVFVKPTSPFLVALKIYSDFLHSSKKVRHGVLLTHTYTEILIQAFIHEHDEIEKEVNTCTDVKRLESYDSRATTLHNACISLNLAVADKYLELPSQIKDTIKNLRKIYDKKMNDELRPCKAILSQYRTLVTQYPKNKLLDNLIILLSDILMDIETTRPSMNTIILKVKKVQHRRFLLISEEYHQLSMLLRDEMLSIEEIADIDSKIACLNTLSQFCPALFDKMKDLGAFRDKKRQERESEQTLPVEPRYYSF